MINQLRQAILNETSKLIKNRTSYIYLAIILVLIIASSFGIKLIENTSGANNGYSFVLFSLQAVSTTILPFLLLMFSANIISSEKSSGTIRNILVSGCSKSHFILSKLISSFLFQLALMGLSALIAITIGYLLFGFGKISEDGLIIMSQYQFWLQFLISYTCLAIVLFAAISFGIMISTIAQTTISAVVMAIGSYIVLESIKAKLHIESYIYSSYIEFPLGNLSNLVEGFRVSWMPKIYHCLTVSTLWILITSTLSFIIIKKSEFK